MHHPISRDPAELARALAAEPRPFIVDVREHDELRHGGIAESVHLPLSELEAAPAARLRALGLVPDAGPSGLAVVFVCATGRRSQRAAALARDAGLEGASDLAGGLEAWRAAGHSIAPPRPGASDAIRYSRQTRLPEIGTAGQDRIGAARVAVIGAGGLGAPVLSYLAAAGVGHLTIIDFDRVDLSNLQRQILFTESAVGEPKVRAAARHLAALNSRLSIAPIVARVTAENAARLLGGHDVVVDATDSLGARYAVNDACVDLGLPLVHGAIYRFEGQLAVFNHAGGPCYRCAFPEPPTPASAPTCAEAGVVGAVCGVVGARQSLEVLKLLVGSPDVLGGRLMGFDLLTNHHFELALAPSPSCRCRRAVAAS